MSSGRKALIVASDHYDGEGLRRLRSPQADASALAAVLADPQIADFDVRVVHNEPSYEVQAQIEELLADSRADDLLLLHFACHGVKNEAGELFFATRNTRLDRLASTAVSADFVQRAMRASRSRSIVLLLDCCYGGAFGAGVSVRAAGTVDVRASFPSSGLDGGRGRAVITASSAMEYAFEGTTLADDHSAPTSVFTDALVRGLSTGEADRDEDGWVSLNELYDYVFDRVRTSTPGQTPTRDVEMQGELYLARSRRKRVKPAAVPPDLLAASHDPNVFTRLGAVSELRSRLLAANLPAAAGAHARLLEIAAEDISYVADAATGALAEAALGLAPTELELGEVLQAAELPPRAVSLTGPPLARTCSIEVSEPAIRVTETAAGFDVSVDTSGVRVVDGTVTVRGPTGEGVVRVRAAVVPAVAEVGAEVAAQHRPRVRRSVGDAPVLAASDAGAAGAGKRTHDDLSAGVEQGSGGHGEVGHGEVGHGGAAATAPAPSARPPRPLAADPAERTVRLWAAVALAGAMALVGGTASPFQWDAPLGEVGADLAWQGFLVAVAAALAAVLVLGRRTRWPGGVGMLLGVVAASSWGLLTLIEAWVLWLRHEGGIGVGYWLMLVGLGALLLAGAVLAGAVVRRPDVGRQRFGELSGWSRAVVGVGVAGGITLTVKAADPAEYQWHWTMSGWFAVLAVVVPLVAASVVPRDLGRWLLAGWVVGAAVVLGTYFVHHDRLVDEGAAPYTAALVGYAVTLAALVVLVVLDARRARASP